MTNQPQPEKSPEQQRFEALAKKVLQAKPSHKAKDGSSQSEQPSQQPQN